MTFPADLQDQHTATPSQTPERMAITPAPPPLPWLYRLTDRLPTPTSFPGKLFLVAFLATHIPLLAVIAYLLVRGGAVSAGAVLPLVQKLTEAFTACAVGSIWLVLLAIERPALVRVLALDGVLPTLEAYGYAAIEP